MRSVLPLLVGALLSLSVAPQAQTRRADELFLKGYVLGPDGAPVSSGRVTLIRAVGSAVNATIDRAGHFQLRPEMSGPHEVVIAAPGLAPSRFTITLPPSRTLTLPVIRLSPATYFRARFVTAAGEPLLSPTLRRFSVDADGFSIPELRDVQPAEPPDGDGAITIGPLPWGITMMSVDTPPFAQTRLRDVVVTGKEPLIDAGVITIQPGAVVQVDIVDEHGAPVPAHNVALEDAAPRSTLGFPVVKTNPQGRATFERVGPGRYRLWTMTKERCGPFPMSFARVIQVGNGGILHERVIVGGQVNLRVVSPLGPMNGRPVSVRPETSTPPPWQPALVNLSRLRRGSTMPTQSSACAGTTDADGRLSLNNVPPGPATVEVRLFNSTYVKRVTVPEGGRDIPIAIPDGLLSVRVTDQRSNEPVSSAKIVWTGNGGRVEALSTANGDALLEAVGTIGGTLAIASPNHQPLEAAFQEPPATVQEVALPPAAAGRLQIKVTSESGAALPNAIVELAPKDSTGVADIAVTEAQGLVTFPDAPAGTSTLSASAEGFVPATVRVSNENRDAAVITLVQGYRVSTSVESNAPGPRAVRVFNDKGDSMDAVLDANSERSFEGSGPISIGPLAPGTYVIELDDGRGPRRERVQIIDRSVTAIIR